MANKIVNYTSYLLHSTSKDNKLEYKMIGGV